MHLRHVVRAAEVPPTPHTTHTGAMNRDNLTPASAAVAAAILAIQEREGGLGATILDIAQETGMDAKAIRGNLADLTKRGIVEIDLCVHSGASFTMLYSNEYVD